MAKLLRAKWLLIPVGLILIAAAYAGWEYLSRWESTDDAQVDGHIHPVNARVGGIVMSVNVVENQRVDAGTIVAQLDSRDYEVAVARAEAELAQAQANAVGARAGIPVASSTAGAQITSSEAIAERAKGGVELASKEVQAAQARFNAAEAHVREAQANALKNSRDLERMKQLVAKDEISLQQYDAAVTSLVKAAEFDPKQSVVWANLAEAYMGQSKTKTGAEQQAAFAKAYEAYAKALELKPDDASAINNYALALAKGGKFPEAQSELNKAAQLDPKNAGKYYYNLGALLVNNQQLEPAGEAFKKAIEADPNYADAYYQYGIYLISKAKTTADGKVTPEPGTKEAFQKYLDLKADGPYAESAKGMLAMMDAQISTEYKNPSAPPKKGAPATKGAAKK